jgi:hypothetical protein
VVQGGAGRCGLPDSGEAGGGDGRVRGGKRSRVRLGSIGALTCGGIGASEQPRRRPVAAADGGVTPACWRLGLDNTREGRLQGVLGHAGATRVGRASGQSGELAVHLQWRGAVALAGRARKRRPAGFIARSRRLSASLHTKASSRGRVVVWARMGGEA